MVDDVEDGVEVLVGRVQFGYGFGVGGGVVGKGVACV